jgi:hypothetical protein
MNSNEFLIWIVNYMGIKTKHSAVETANGVKFHDVYTEISTDDKTFYRFSNDNSVYTEISAPGFIE